MSLDLKEHSPPARMSVAEVREAIGRTLPEGFRSSVRVIRDHDFDRQSGWVSKTVVVVEIYADGYWKAHRGEDAEAAFLAASIELLKWAREQRAERQDS